MWRGILGKKIGMTQFFTEDGKRVGVTVVEAGPCPVLQVKTEEHDGYNALQIGFDEKKEKHSNKAELGHAKKTDNVAQRMVREIRLDEPVEVNEGDKLTLEGWDDVKVVQVTAKSKGKGFQGVMKRYNFKGLRATHGVKTNPRHGGSIGSLTPARTPKGVKMPGHMGKEIVTQKGLSVAKVIPEKNLILIQGSVPGPKGGFVLIRPARPYMPPKA